jgi:hypothetical protein
VDIDMIRTGLRTGTDEELQQLVRRPEALGELANDVLRERDHRAGLHRELAVSDQAIAHFEAELKSASRELKDATGMRKVTLEDAAQTARARLEGAKANREAVRQALKVS